MPPTKTSGSGAGTVDTGYGPGVAPTGAGAPAGSSTPARPLVDLRNLASYRGRVVEVGGLVTSVESATISIDDGTAAGRLVLSGEAAAYLDLVEVGDPIEVDGLVEPMQRALPVRDAIPTASSGRATPMRPSPASPVPSEATASLTAGAGAVTAGSGPQSGGSAGAGRIGGNGVSETGLDSA